MAMLLRRTLGKNVTDKTSWEISKDTKAILRSYNVKSIDKINKYFPHFLVGYTILVVVLSSFPSHYKIWEILIGTLKLDLLVVVAWLILNGYVRTNQLVCSKITLSRYENEIIELEIDKNNIVEIVSCKILQKYHEEYVLMVKTGMLSYTISIPIQIYDKYILNNSKIEIK
jgi:hypothetical protein